MHPLKSSIVPIVPAGTRDAGLQKSPSKMFLRILKQGCKKGVEKPCKIHPKPGEGKLWGLQSILKNPGCRTGLYPHPSQPRGLFLTPHPGSRTRGTGNDICRDFPALQAGLIFSRGGRTGYLCKYLTKIPQCGCTCEHPRTQRVPYSPKERKKHQITRKKKIN